MCAHHKTIHEGHSNLANQIAAQTGLAQEEHEELTPHTGTCVECKRRAGKGELMHSLDSALPTGYRKKQDQSDRTPRRPFEPGKTRTKPLEPLPPSLNAVQASSEEMRPLPGALYHVTTARDAVLAHGLKNRTELGQQYGHGLGGGRDDTISLTTHRPTAEHLLHSLHEYHDVLNGKIKLADLKEKARQGVGAEKPYDYMLKDHADEDLAAADKGRAIEHRMHDRSEVGEDWKPLDEGMHGTGPQGEYHLHMAWDRPLDRSELLHKRDDVYKKFSWGRQGAGGHPDPLFIANDPGEFVKKDPGQFALMHVRPHEGAHGIQMNDRTEGTDAGEWRALSGKDLHVVHHEGREAITPRTAAADHHVFYHVTDNPNFELSTTHRPHLNLEGGEDEHREPGIHMADHEGINRWMGTGGYIRPYMVELHAHPELDDHPDTEHGFARERYVPAKHYDKLKVHRVIPLDAWDREQGGYGHMEQSLGSEYDTGAPIASSHEDRPYRPRTPYTGPDAREMTPEQHQHHTDRYDRFMSDRISRQAASYPIKYTRMTQNGYEDVEDEIEGPLFHGSRSKRLQPGDMITKGRKTNPWGDQGPKSQTVHFTVHHDTARDYADQAGGHVYEVEPTGEFKHDYSGGDFKTAHPLRVVRMVPRSEWEASKEASRRTAMTPERRAEIERIRQERKNRPRRPAGQPRADAFSHLFTPIPEHELEEQRQARMPKPEPINDKTYSIGDVSKHYEWEGFDPYEIEHLVHHPEHAQFTHEDVPVHSLRHITEHGELVKPPSYRDIADQGDDEQERLGELERGHDDGAHIPPIVVVRHGEHHIIADGSHRAAIAAERGHTHIPAFVTERTIMPKTGRMGDGGPDPFERTAAMHNPNAKAGQAEDEWYHGSPHDFDSFSDTGSSNDTEDHVNHWNVLLGNHFTATHNVAHDFSLGLHHASDANGNDDAEEPLGHVIHARLHIKRPKVYKSEHDMDQEVHEHEVKRGNLLDPHLPETPHEDADDDEWDDYYADAGHARVYRGDSHGPFGPNEPDPNVAHGFHPKATGWLNHHPDKEGIAARHKARLIKQGYDGIVYGNEFERADAGGKEKSAIAFHPHQVEITQHHYGRTGQCLNPEECARQRAADHDPGQLALPMEHTSALTAGGVSRLALPLPAECWSRYRSTLGDRTASWDDDDEWSEDETFHCPACGEDHEDEETRDNHMMAHTDWDRVHPKLPDTLHRGMAVSLPDEVHDVVHDESRPSAERAQALADHVKKRGLGMHFTDDKQQAAHYSHVYHQPGDTHVIVHSRKPDMHHIETDPGELESQQVIGYGQHDDNEIPIRSGAPVHATGISWKHEDPKADWHTHNFGRSMEMTAMRKQAHDSGDGQRIFHCPFCGAGQVIARSDGTTECEFCHQAFTVQVQPQFNSFPQTDPTTGLPIMIPGMPGQIDAPGTPPGAPGGALPPGADEESDNPFAADSGDESGPPGADDGGDDSGDGGDDNKPDFLKGSSFRTASGDLLTEAAYTRHLALRFSANPEKMIELLRSGR
jgi:hypothetical protein